MDLKIAQRGLLNWYAQNKRELPWRRDRDPYRIWISETMLQQTTTTAVIPYFERFTARFPTLKSLAQAKTELVVEAWAGLGYYSRARNLHKSAVALFAGGGFPKTFEDLIEYPGFGPYTARSVASLAFDQSVGVVDGNVVRVLARVYDRDWEFWKPKVRDEIQVLVDQWVKGVSSYEMNQAIMELGRTICTPKSPSCLLCPIRASCLAFKKETIALRPKSKPKKEREIWIWEPHIWGKKDQALFEMNEDIPFLKGQWLLPGPARRVKQKPRTFDFKHTITHHDIYVTVSVSKPITKNQVQWIRLKEIRQHVPASLVHKAFAQLDVARGNKPRRV